MAEGDPHITLYDYIVFGLTLAASLGIGVVASLTGGKQKTASEYLYGDRKMAVVPVALSLIVSFVSPITLQGAPAEVYLYGLQYIMYVVSYTWSGILCAILYPSFFYPLKLTSVLEYYELRFNSKTIRIAATVLTLYSSIMYSGVVIFGPSTALEGVIGVPVSIVMIVIVLISTIYTTIGGIKAVIWSDALQAMIMLAGLGSMVIVGALKVGGLSHIVDILQEGGRLNIFQSLHFDPTQRQSVWLLSIAGGFTLPGIIQSQTAVQRYTSVNTTNKAGLCIIIFTVGLVLLFSLSCATGAVVYAYYADIGCDPLADKSLSNANQLTPYFAMEVLNYPGIPGLFLASLFAASLSTISSTQNAMAAIIWEDLLKGRRLCKEVSPVTETLILKFLVVLSGLLSLAAGFAAYGIGGTLFKIITMISSTPYNILGGMMLAGSLCPWTSAISTMISAAAVLTMLIWINIGGMFLPERHFPLPTVTHNCTSTFNSTLDTWTATSNITESVPHDFRTDGSITTWLYSISFLLIPCIAFVSTIVLSMLLALLPCFRHKGNVPNKYLLWIVRCCRNEAKMEEESAQETTKKRYMYHQVEVIRTSVENLSTNEGRNSTTCEG